MLLTFFFIRVVISSVEFVNYTQDAPELDTQSPSLSTGLEEPMTEIVITGVDYDEIMSRIRHIVLTNRRRVSISFEQLYKYCLTYHENCMVYHDIPIA